MLVKKSSLCLFVFTISLLLGCSHLNEFGQDRVNFNFERIKPNKDNLAYKIIDTSKIYLRVSYENTSDSSVNAEYNRMNILNPRYLKFYANGRVGEFTKVDLNKIETLNPKKAQSNLYAFKKGKFIVQSYFISAQCGECFVKGTLEKISQDTIQIVTDDHLEKYKAIKIPQDFLIYKPDW